MLTGVNVVLLGGDARQLEVIRKLTELDATVVVAGFDGLHSPLDGAVKAELHGELFDDADALILPAVGTDDEGVVTAVFSDKELRLLEEHVDRLPKHCKVYTGLAKPYLRQLCGKYGIAVIELFERDDVAIYNSIPTAEGAIMMAIQNTDITIHGSTSLVLGLGRTGFTLARTLQGMGARVLVGVRREEHFARAEEMGFKPLYIKDLLHYAGNLDLLFNTIPTMIVTAQIIAKLPSRAVIIDLASKPGGTDFRFAEKRGIKAMLAPGLPGIVAPKTAGRIIADCLSRLIMEDLRVRGDEQ
ncbi:dipicolinate synthase subunit A [Paenibacillus darwinianus]|uniref:Dipicolinate synthase subunit A n=1 Tax=Paenibacillus darwinianus TaxID=1380763 RepID=A0A9W5W7Y8_9BACL|nr:dipicolinate synthase subunit DpsA [Paenibacillus darwinianus]EXX91217.1 dipicolinate synthase subunit A [Paenibacillus darwinianus]EXX92147.1 dipicolinate synthase subunit A [Paenibacillus darwinianus]EXX92798.1 dipicolinate synthase subunit A [Paenibacillus darwinianus]